MLLVDTNVLLDVVEDDPRWGDWSKRRLEAQSLRYRLIINATIYAELSIGYQRIEELDQMLATASIAVVSIPRPALFLASKAFQRYRAQGGAKTGVLPDFFIGAHAAVANLPLLTRDTRRYRAYFPTVSLMTPEL
ncbi:MAG: PIN domain-containing protein [Proteobacteria bacterium]|nr:PIN domain-containing protein [Pseudomonadota bacterium]